MIIKIRKEKPKLPDSVHRLISVVLFRYNIFRR